MMSRFSPHRKPSFEKLNDYLFFYVSLTRYWLSVWPVRGVGPAMCYYVQLMTKVSADTLSIILQTDRTHDVMISLLHENKDGHCNEYEGLVIVSIST